MKKIHTLAFLAGAVLMFISQAAHAGMADGSYTNDLGALVPLWDISGEYTNTVDLYTFDFALTQEASGKLAGGGTFTVLGTYDGIDFNVTNGVVVATGKVSGSSTAPKVSMTTAGSASGTAVYDGIPLEVTKLKEISTFTGELDAASGEVVGNLTVAVAATFRDEATGKSKSKSKIQTYKDVSFQLSTNAVGTNWTLTLNLTPDGGTKYNIGSATVVTSTGDTATFTAAGTYASKTDTSEILLVGDASSKGSDLTLKISTTTSNLTVETLSGNVFGQSLKYKAP